MKANKLIFYFMGTILGIFLFSACNPSNTDPTSIPPTNTRIATTIIPLMRAHAHNDYEHKEPLFDALNYGFTSIEVDVHLVEGELLVAHDLDEVEQGQTLTSLYLEPLKKQIIENGGKVYNHGPQITLIIDIKSEPEETYRVLSNTLTEYQDIFTEFGPSGVREGPIIAIISGNRPRELMKSQLIRYAAYDGRIEDLGSADSADFIPLISDKWTDLFSWNGIDAMSEQEREKLRSIVNDAHSQGRRIRFWGTPDNPSMARDAVWLELVKAEVDLINTDDLQGLQKFLLTNDPKLSGNNDNFND